MTSKTIALVVAALLGASPAAAQLGSLGKTLGKAQEVAEGLTFTEAEEQQIGSDISARLRERYGVVQDRAVHKYVALTGSLLAAASTRPELKWTFVVLDTDGVNAFAAPGGLVHITRGAMALMKSEAELAGVLGHEIAHITAKHTLNAIRKSKIVGLGAEASRREVLSQAADRGYEILLENSFDRGDEIGADKVGVTLVNRVGYAPSGLSAFLTRLAERNKALTDRSGIFASHPESRARIDAVSKAITAGKLTAAAVVAPRYASSVTFTAAAGVGSAASPGGQSGSGGSSLGLGGMSALGRERASDQTVSSAGSRGVNPDRDAKGGPNKALVAVSVTAAEITEFRKGIV